MMPPPSGVNNGPDGTMLTEHMNDAQVNQVMAALSVIGINCVNVRRIMQKFGEFIEALENHANFRDLRSNADRLMGLINGDPMCFPRVDNGDAVSIVTLSDSGRGMLKSRVELRGRENRTMYNRISYFLFELKNGDLEFTNRATGPYEKIWSG